MRWRWRFETRRHRKDPEKRRPCDDGGRDLGDAATSQGTLKTASNHPKLGEKLGEARREGILSQNQREEATLPTP